MGLDVVITEILEQGRGRAQEILREAEREAKTLRDDVEKRVAQEAQRAQTQAKKDAERHRLQELARAEFEAKKKVLDAQKMLWDELNAKTLEALRTLPAERTQRVLRSLAKKSKAVLPNGVVFAREADRWVANETGYAWGGAGGAAGSSASQYRFDAKETVGGFLVESSDGSVVLDYRFETLLEDMWKDLMREESAALFGKLATDHVHGKN